VNHAHTRFTKEMSGNVGWENYESHAASMTLLWNSMTQGNKQFITVENMK